MAEPPALEYRILPSNGSGWYWEVVTQSREVIARGLAGGHPRMALTACVLGLWRRNVSLEMQMLNPWFAFSFQAARLGYQAQNAMTLRLLRLAGGVVVDRSAAHLIVPEVAARTEAAGATVAIKGANGRDVVKKVISDKKRVRRKKRRPSR
jgi:hypothetical protein